MRFLLLTSESELESMVLRQIRDIKRQYNEWADPRALADALESSIVTGNLGTGREGAVLADTIVLDPSSLSERTKQGSWRLLCQRASH